MARPTKYDPAMCEQVVELMRVGASKTEVCAELDICFDTLIAWQEAHSEFSEAVKRGVQLCQAWWEREGRTALRDKDFSYTGWYMNMKNRFGWKDKQEIGGDASAPLIMKIERVIIDDTADRDSEGL